MSPTEIPSRRSRASCVVLQRQHSGRLNLVDLSDPDYFFYFDVLGNPIWGALAADFFPSWTDGFVVWCTDHCPGIGQSGAGDDLMVRTGLDAGNRTSLKTLTAGDVVHSIRNRITDLLALAEEGRRDLTRDNVKLNKIVRRREI